MAARAGWVPVMMESGSMGVTGKGPVADLNTTTTGIATAIATIASTASPKGPVAPVGIHE
jgi:hypothetical protein